MRPRLCELAPAGKGCQDRTIKGPLFRGTVCTEVKLFMENGVRGRAQTAGVNSRRGATKKREISRNLFSINVHS